MESVTAVSVSSVSVLLPSVSEPLVPSSVSEPVVSSLVSEPFVASELFIISSVIPYASRLTDTFQFTRSKTTVFPFAATISAK